jgi:hypothetical protein
MGEINKCVVLCANCHRRAHVGLFQAEESMLCLVDETVWCEYNRDIYRQIWRDRWNPYENRPAKDIQEVFRLIRQLINSDPSRLAAILEAMEKHTKLIVFYNFNYERTLIHGLVQSLKRFESEKAQPSIMSTNPSSSITMAEWSGHIHQSIPKTDRWLYIVQYSAGAEAWNCIETDAMLFYSLTYSGKVFEQCQGRIDRINTPFKDLHYYILRSEAPVETGIWDSLMNKKDFNEKTFVASITKSFLFIHLCSFWQSLSR